MQMRAPTVRSRPAVPSPKPSPATLMVSSNATITAPATSAHATLMVSSGNDSQQAVTFSSALSGMSQEVTINSNRSGVSQAAAGSGAGGWASQAVTISSNRSGVSQAAAGSGAGWASQASSSSQRLF